MNILRKLVVFDVDCILWNFGIEGGFTKLAKKFGHRKEVEEIHEESKKRNYIVAAFSSNPTVILEILQKKLNIDCVFGNVLEAKNGKFTGRFTKKMDRYQKTDELKKLVKKLSIRRNDIYVIGDSITDVPMTKEGGTFIVFNPKDEVEEYADHAVKSNDLQDILRYIK
ncbi:MAG: HAD-IB family phosphatase [Candidatus Aenigmarchaeota archaeon]|nr:HAD-IB family phosphatase [Candidatus Aenigmarchaeota archaeon]